VEAEVVAGVIARSAAEFVDPDAMFSVESYASSDGVAVGAGSGEFESEPVVVVLCDVA
jgi:hypothetical protein